MKTITKVIERARDKGEEEERMNKEERMAVRRIEAGNVSGNRTG